MPAHDYQVRKVGESRSVTHYRVSAGPKGGSEVTVRVGVHGVFACLTCIPTATTCPHAIAAPDYAQREQQRATTTTTEAA